MEVHGTSGAGGIHEPRVHHRAGVVLPGRCLPCNEGNAVGIVKQSEHPTDAAGQEDIASRSQAGGVHSRTSVGHGVVLAGATAIGAGVDEDIVPNRAFIQRIGALKGEGLVCSCKVCASYINGIVMDVPARPVASFQDAVYSGNACRAGPSAIDSHPNHVVFSVENSVGEVHSDHS